MRAGGLLLVVALLGSDGAWAWGQQGHHYLATHALDALPTTHCLRQWLAARADNGFREASMAPDVRRERDSETFDPHEGPRHYLDVDAVTPPASYPRELEAVVKQFGEARAEKLGRLPWHVESVLSELTALFKKGDEPAVATAFAEATHYISDAYSPLHATLEYNPKLGPEDGDGAHIRYEERMFEPAGRLDEVAAAVAVPRATKAKSPRDAKFEAILSGLPLAGQIVAADVAAKGDATKLFAATKALTARRFSEAIRAETDLLVRAWKDAGSPRLPAMPDKCSMK